MSSYAEQIGGELVLVADKLEDAYAAITTNKRLSIEGENLAEILHEYGWELDYDTVDDEELVLETFDGKWSSEHERLLETLAPFVSEDQERIEFRNGEGDFFAFSFSDGECTELVGKLSWAVV